MNADRTPRGTRRYGRTGTTIDEKCAVCGKAFLRSPEYAYCKQREDVTIWYCSYSCLRADEKRESDKGRERDKKRKAVERPAPNLDAFAAQWAQQKAKKPARMLTREEAMRLPLPQTVWLELSGTGSKTYPANPVQIAGMDAWGMTFGQGYSGRPWSAYNRSKTGWRVWTAEPTEDEQTNAKWEGGA